MFVLGRMFLILWTVLVFLVSLVVPDIVDSSCICVTIVVPDIMGACVFCQSSCS